MPKEVVQERFDRLMALQERMSMSKARAQVGKTLEVLVEGADKKGVSTQARSRTNRIVHLAAALDPGTFVQARITDAAAHHLTGEVVSTPAPRPSRSDRVRR